MNHSHPELLRLTELAATKVKETLVAAGLDPNTPLRVKVVGGGCAGYSYEMNPEEDSPAVNPDEESSRVADRVITSYGVVCRVDEMSLMYLAGTEIGFVESLRATGFTFNNPNTTSTCGCGSSFSA